MIKEAEVLMKEVKDRLQQLLPLLQTLKQYQIDHPLAITEITDIAFVCREAITEMEEFTKATNKVYYEAQSNVTILLGIAQESKVQTDYCTATPNPRIWYKIPYKRENDSERWDAIMEDIGVSQLASQQDLVRIHPPGLMDYCTNLMGEGKELPAGITPKDVIGVDFRLKLIRRRT